MASTGIFSQILSRFTNTVQSQINSISRLTTKIQNIFNNITQKLQNKLRTLISSMSSKPKSKADYYKILGLYFAKRFVFIGIMVIGAIIYIYVNLVHPNLEGKLWYAKLAINSNKAQQFSGKAKLRNIDGKLIYKGDVYAGTPSGQGIQYDLDGNLIYKGNFKMGKYEGSGEIYDSSGNLVYSGNFESNKYEGAGKIVNSFGKVVYVGNFEKGLKSGKGTEFDPRNGNRRYYGEFTNDKYEGKGMLYDSLNNLVYEGNFKDGLYDGKGKKYQNSHLIFDGNFKSGEYSGEGMLYDEASGGIIYSGEFEKGLYNGSGKLYDISTFNIIYDGEFKEGKKNGKGILYDKLGVPVFNGDFRNDAIDYMSNFGTKIEDFVEKFGKYTSQSFSDGKIILFYNPIDSAMIFEKKSNGDYIFERAILGTKNNFMGVGAESTIIERRNILGQSFVSTKYDLSEYQKDAISMLKINLEKNYSIPSDKYIFENYFVRFYFNDDKSKIYFIEVGQL